MRNLVVGDKVKTSEEYNNHWLTTKKPITAGTIITINNDNIATVKIGKRTREINVYWLEKVI